MTADRPYRSGWLQALYVYTMAGAGGFGLGILAMPDRMRSLLGWPEQDPVMLGIAGSVFLGFALVSALGLRAPLRYAPVLLLQLVYKALWFAALIAPLWARGDFPALGWVPVAVFAT